MPFHSKKEKENKPFLMRMLAGYLGIPEDALDNFNPQEFFHQINNVAQDLRAGIADFKMRLTSIDARLSRIEERLKIQGPIAILDIGVTVNAERGKSESDSGSDTGESTTKLRLA